MRAHVTGGATDRPGIYRMISADGEVLYVGKSKAVRTRLLSYFRCAFPEEKGARILREARSIDWEYVPNEFAALLREMRLIKSLRPRYNVSLKNDGRNLVFIKLTRGPAPRLVVVRGASADDAATYYGPFFGAQRVDEALRELADVLGLRDCTHDRKMKFADQQELFPMTGRTPGCIRYEIRKCLGPCIAACTEHEYDERIALARAFLDGRNDGPMAMLRGDMEAASERLEFERAALLRDKLERLELLREQFLKLRYALETLTFSYTVKGSDGVERVYLIQRGCVRAECERPKTAGERRQFHRLAKSIFAEQPRRGRHPLALPQHEVDEVLLVSSWFRRFPDEMRRTKPISVNPTGLKTKTAAG